MVGTRRKEHRYAYRIYGHRTEEGSVGIAGKRKVREDCRGWMISILRPTRFCWRWRCLCLGTWKSRSPWMYRFHYPEWPVVILGLLELLVEDDVFTGEQEGRRQEIILVWLLLVVLLVEGPLEFFEVFVEHVLTTELVPASEVVDLHVGKDAVLLEDPVDLLFLAPDDIPVIVPALPPLSVLEGIVNAVFERCLELHVCSES